MKNHIENQHNKTHDRSADLAKKSLKSMKQEKSRILQVNLDDAN